MTCVLLILLDVQNISIYYVRKRDFHLTFYPLAIFDYIGPVRGLYRPMGVHFTPSRFSLYSTPKFACSLTTFSYHRLIATICRCTAMLYVDEQVGRFASEEVILELILQKCLPILTYGLEVCALPKRVLQSQSLDFTANRVLMKLFKSSNTVVIKQCIYFFHIELP